MKQEGLSFFTDTYLTIIALLIFFAFFGFVLIRAIIFKKEEIKKFENMPLQNDLHIHTLEQVKTIGLANGGNHV